MPAPPPSKYGLGSQVRPGFGTLATEDADNLVGDTYYTSDHREIGRLPGNTDATLKVLGQTGTGSASAAPTWVSPSALGGFGATGPSGVAGATGASGVAGVTGVTGPAGAGASDIDGGFPSSTYGGITSINAGGP